MNGADHNVEHDLEVKVIRYIYKHRAVMLYVFLFVFLTGALYTFIAPKYYESSTSFFFTSSKGQLGGMLSNFGISLGGDSVSSYAVSILKSNTISKLVIREHGGKIFGENKFKKSKIGTLIKKLPKYTKIEKKEGGIITVTVYNRDPNAAAEIANYYVKKYLEFEEEAVVTSSKRYRIHIQQQKERVKKELQAGELQLLAFQQKEKVVEPQAEMKAMLDYYAEIKSAAIVTKVSSEEANSRLSAVQSKIFQANSRAAVDPSNPAEITSPQVTELYNQLIRKELELAKAKGKFTDKNVKVRELEEDAGSIKTLLKKRVEEYLKNVSEDTDPVLVQLYADSISQRAKNKAFEQTTKEIENQLREIPDIAFSYRRLYRDVLVKEKIYSLLEVELQKAIGEEAKNQTTINIIDKAVPADFPVRPQKKLYLIGFLILGILFALIAALLQDKIIEVRAIVNRISVEEPDEYYKE